MSHVSRYLDPALVEQLKSLSVGARSVVEGSALGLHRSAMKGASVDFRHHRFYVRGDEPRRLDWRVLARTDRPYVKEYDEETQLRCLLMLDCSGSMKYGGSAGTKFDFGARIVAALSYLMLSQTENVGLALYGRDLGTWLKPGGGPHQLARIIDALERAAPAGRSGLARPISACAERLERRALVVIVSDFFSPPEEFRDGVARLRHDRHEVAAVQVTDRDEEEFPFDTWRRFRGLEGEAPFLTEPAVVKKRYLEAFAAHRGRLRETAQGLGADYQSVTTHKPLLDELRKVILRRSGA